MDNKNVLLAGANRLLVFNHLKSNLKLNQNHRTYSSRSSRNFLSITRGKEVRKQKITI